MGLALVSGFLWRVDQRRQVAVQDREQLLAPATVDLGIIFGRIIGMTTMSRMTLARH